LVNFTKFSLSSSSSWAELTLFSVSPADGLHKISYELHNIGTGLHNIGDGLHNIADGLHNIADGLHNIREKYCKAHSQLG
jgi:hypothetical protein